MDLPALSWATLNYLHMVEAEVVQQGIFERLGFPLQEDWNMVLAELENLQKREVNMQP